VELRYKPRPTRKLGEIVESDLITAQEKFINGQIGGYYTMADELAYFRVAGEKTQVTVDEFERMLKKEVHPQFFVIFNPHVTKNHMVEGHNIGFYVPEHGGFVPLCRVGRSGQNIIPANSQGSKEKYIGAKSLREKEKVVIMRGYVAAREFCKQFIFDAVKTGGIHRSRIIKSSEYMVFKDLKSNLGGDKVVEAMFREAKKLRDDEADRMIEAARAKEARLRELTKAAAVEYDGLTKEENKDISIKTKEEIKEEVTTNGAL
jgi:hypothetical protein